MNRRVKKGDLAPVDAVIHGPMELELHGFRLEFLTGNIEKLLYLMLVFRQDHGLDLSVEPGFESKAAADALGGGYL